VFISPELLQNGTYRPVSHGLLGRTIGWGWHDWHMPESSTSVDLEFAVAIARQAGRLLTDS